MMGAGPDMLERTRMALAEVGADTNGVHRIRPGVITTRSRLVDNRTAWRAVSIAKMAHNRTRIPMCYRCTIAAHPIAGIKDAYLAARDRCDARLPLTEDCGVVR